MSAQDWSSKLRVLVGESVFEDATVTFTVQDRTLWVEFDSGDLDSIAIPLGETPLDKCPSENAAKRARKDAIDAAVAVLWRSGLGKLSREDCRVEAERVIDALVVEKGLTDEM